MDNFNFHVTTDIRFGKDRLNELPAVLNQFGKKVLVTYGGGSIKKIGLYDRVMAQLKANGNEVFELAGVEPNPRIETVEKGIAICRKEKIDVVLAVGGGSTIDCAKAIAAGTLYAGQAWDMVLERKNFNGPALPLVTILTLAATGSEMNSGAVISNLTTNQKLGFGGPSMLPKASFLDPQNTFSVGKYQTAAGSADIFSHLMENYFKQTVGSDVQDFVAEGLMRTVIKNCPIALKTPTDYDARANLMWASSLALNGLTGNGKLGSWSCHPIEHELSAFYDITHGVGLAILTPRWMEYCLSEATVDKFAQYAWNVWQVDEKVPMMAARMGIQKLYDYFKACDIPMTLPEVGIKDDHKFAVMAEQAVKFNAIKDQAYVSLDEQAVVEILNNCLTESSFV